jgi:hypothetical protein
MVAVDGAASATPVVPATAATTVTAPTVARQPVLNLLMPISSYA